jgi:DNA helicase INO80
MKLPPARDTRPHHHHHHHHHHLAPSPSSFTPSHIPRPKFCSFAARATHVARDRAFSHKSDTASNRHLVRKQPTRKRRNETRAKRHDIHHHKPPPPPLPHPTTSSSSSSSFFPSPPKPNTSRNHRGVPDHLRFFFFTFSGETRAYEDFPSM